MVELENIKSLIYGYTATISEIKVFIVAKNTSEALDKLDILSNGKDFNLNSHSSLPILNLESVELLLIKLDFAKKALLDIEKWDDNLEDEWDDVGWRARAALNRIDTYQRVNKYE